MYSELPTSAGSHIMKGNLLDLDFAMDADHRKRRRNRTTQSCLNCHTSKRKCDRKRPCQRCIQLGLTGLCVYEVDDPAARDDPDVDETTKLRNRIAELESVVRELRGKPHPKWADPNFYEGDASDKWHTRSQKRNQPLKGRGLADVDSQIAVKLEPALDMSQTPFYRISASPPDTPSCDAFHSGSYATHTGAPMYDVPSSMDSNMSYSPSSSSTAGFPACGESSDSMSHMHNQSMFQYPGSHATESFVKHSYGVEAFHDPQPSYEASQSGMPCPCLSNPATAPCFINLARQLQASTNFLQQLPEHGQHTRCVVFKRLSELNNILHGGEAHKSTHSPFGGFEPQPAHLRSPTDSDIMSPLSVSQSSSLASPDGLPHTMQAAHHWESSHGTGYNPYFP